jgi:ubiquinone/menaquinone biosynthesis C-methylase UbiE
MSNKSGFQVSGTAPENYDRYTSVFMSPFVDVLVQKANLSNGNAVLDVACGTGIVARRAASDVGLGGRIVGLDPNGGMLQVAQTVSANIEPEIV